MKNATLASQYESLGAEIFHSASACSSNAPWDKMVGMYMCVWYVHFSTGNYTGVTVAPSLVFPLWRPACKRFLLVICTLHRPARQPIRNDTSDSVDLSDPNLCTTYHAKCPLSNWTCSTTHLHTHTCMHAHTLSLSLWVPCVIVSACE